MKLASDYVKTNINNLELNDDELLQSLQSLRLMFRGGTHYIPELFQTVAYGFISRTALSWEKFENGKWCSHEWGLSKRKSIAKGCEEVKDMEPDILYYPEDPCFPGIGFVFVKPMGKNKPQVFGMQITFSEHHQKPKLLYQTLYECLGQ